MEMVNNLNINDIIQMLNYKYQIVKRNKHWNYEIKYNVNGNIVDENDILLTLSNNIARNVNDKNINLNSLNDYEIPNVNYEQMKKIVLSFFLNINPKYSDKLSYIFSKIQVTNGDGRSVTTEDGIKFYYKNDLNSLVTLAHEVSHCLANLDNNNEIKNQNKIDSFAEIESELTEELFLEKLIDINIAVVDKKSNNSEIRLLNSDDLRNIRYNKLKSAISHTYRALDEIPFKKIIEENGFSEINEDLINKICEIKNIPLNDENKRRVCQRIEMFLNPYYPDNSQIHEIKDGYDLKNGRHLSNECRFIYAYCFVEKFNNMKLTPTEKVQFYKNYMEKAKDLSFEDVLKQFNIDISNPLSITDDFINNFNNIVNKENLNYKKL